MTANLLRSSLANHYRLIHYNISKGRKVGTKARFDLVNLVFGSLQPFKLLALMIWYRPALVYTNLAQNLGGFLRYTSFILVAGMFPSRIVVRVMGDGFNHFYNRSGRVLRWIMRRVVRRIDGFIVRADVLKQQFEGIVPPEKLHVVYSGIDTAPFDTPRTRGDDQNLRILFVGYLTQAKGALDLLEAVSIVAAQHPQVIFQLMGDKIDVERNITYIDNPDSNEARLAQLLSQPEISRHIDLLGVQTGREKIETFVNADIFVMPSYSEAFPTVVLEAMAAGLPVVATPVGALTEVFTEQEIRFVPIGQVGKLADVIMGVIEHPELRQSMGRHNQARIEQDFNLDAYGRRITDLARRIVEP